MLPTAVLGRTGMSVTRLGYGAAELRGPLSFGGRPFDEGQADRILNAVLDAGINYIDTAPDYGRSEHMIGRYISHRRGEYYLASKCGCVLNYSHYHDPNHQWTRRTLLRGLETSLRRLKTDYLDVWQLHTPRYAEDVLKEDLAELMVQVRESGKVRFVGNSAVLPAIEAFIDWGVFDVFQIPYSALQREHEASITHAVARGAGTVIRGGVARGAPEDGGQGTEELWGRWKQAKLDELLEEGESPTRFMLRYTLAHPSVHTTIVATLNVDHLAGNVEAAEAGPLPEEVYAEARRRLEALPAVAR